MKNSSTEFVAALFCVVLAIALILLVIAWEFIFPVIGLLWAIGWLK